MGNANNFLSLSDCELVCPGILLLSKNKPHDLVLPNPCNQGEPLLDLSKEPVICGGEDSCASGYWCHVGATPETTNCCPGSKFLFYLLLRQ